MCGTGRYILINGEPVPCPDLLAWAEWFEHTDRTLARDMVGAAQVSTVFLGMDHSFSDAGPPVLWETMIFGGPLDGEQKRYRSAEAARAGHAEFVVLLRMAASMNASE
jgi:hypothetical protein